MARVLEQQVGDSKDRAAAIRARLMEKKKAAAAAAKAEDE